MTAISVIMSTYNDAEYLAESIESVLAQTFTDFEFIIINDGSTDPRTKGILSEYEKRDNRIRVICKDNEGLTKALIEGCGSAKGEYVARIDVGDMMVESRLSKQKRVLDVNRDCVFVSCQTEFCGPEWEHLWVKQVRPASGKPVAVIPDDPNGPEGFIPHHGSVMFRQEDYSSVGGYREQFYYGQDWDLWYRLVDAGKFFFVPEVLYRVRVFPGSISMSVKHCQDAAHECSKGAFEARRRGEDEGPWLEKASSICPHASREGEKKAPKGSKESGFYFIGEALRRNGDLRCRRYFCEAVRQDPLRLRSYIRWVQSLFGKMVDNATMPGSHKSIP